MKKIIIFIPIAVIIILASFYFFKKDKPFLENKEFIVSLEDLSGISEVKNNPKDLIIQNFDSYLENFEILATKIDFKSNSYQMAFKLENLDDKPKEFYLIPVSEKSQIEFMGIKGEVAGKGNVLLERKDVINKPLSEIYDVSSHQNELRPDLAQAYYDIKSGKYEPSPIKFVLSARSVLTASALWSIKTLSAGAGAEDRVSGTDGLKPVYLLVFGSAGGAKDRLAILSAYSHFKKGDNWEISFKTKGTADLVIFPKDQPSSDNLDFLSLACNNQAKTPNVSSGTVSFSDWSCNGKGKITYKVKKDGDYQVEIRFGNESEIIETDYRKIHGELLVQLGDDPSGSFEEGDIIHAVNETRALDVNAQNIISPKDAPKKKNKRREESSLLDIYLQNTKEYKFQRISQTEIKRINLETKAEDILSNTPNADKEYIHVQMYIDYAVNSPNHQIFGELGQEYWYGGKTITTLDKLENIWQEIEFRTEHKKKDNMKYPFGPDELKNYLVVSVDDFTNEEAGEYLSPLTGGVDENGDPAVLKSRKYKVDLSGMSKDKTKIKDNRDRKLDRNQIIKPK